MTTREARKGLFACVEDRHSRRAELGYLFSSEHAMASLSEKDVGPPD
jgi:hypothetical protein